MQKRFIFLVAAILLAILNTTSAQKMAIPDYSQKIEELIAKLTLEEKIAMIHGDTYFTTPGIARLGIPGFTLSDGPCGVREENNPADWGSANWKNDSSAYFPSLTALANTWNPALALRFGVVYGEEAFARRKMIALMPGINLHRTPLCGRNWEYMSEDPFIIRSFVVPLIQGVQSEGVAACVKHYALNNQEILRNSIDVEVDERTLRELYLPGFEAAVKQGGALAVMGAYNKYRGIHASHNPWLINDILKGEWGFRGIVISDWDAAHNTREAALNGLDLEMGTNVPTFDDYYMARPLLDSIRAGLIDEKVVDDKVRRLLYVMFRLNMFSRPPYDTTGLAASLALPHRREVALNIAEEAIVLAKNVNHTLPVDLKKVKRIAVIGDNATRLHAHGGGSTIIKAKYEVTPLEGIRQWAGDSIEVRFAPGYIYANKEGWKYDKKLDRLDSAMLGQATDLAAQSDLVIYIGGLNHDHGLDCESNDRADMKLPYRQDDVINALLKANPNTVVILITGSPVEMGDWVEMAPALLITSYLGSESGYAIANVLSGKVNPSGKLATTFPRRLEDAPCHAIGEYPGNSQVVVYNEGLLTGYRYYDTRHVEPLFPFGYGLSYTSFAYSDLKVPSRIKHGKPLKISFTITNTGDVAGKETAQIYVVDLESSLPRPAKELKGFLKTELMPGEARKVTVELAPDAFSFYHPEQKKWITEKGDFEILVGSSSRNILLAARTSY